MKNKKHSKKTGLPPGSIIYTGKYNESIHNIVLHTFNAQEISLHQPTTIEKIKENFDNNKIHWLQVVGFNQIENIKNIGQTFEISDLELEDILDVNQRPNCSVTDDFVSLTLKTASITQETDLKISYHQVSILMTTQIIITFQEKDDGIFQSLFERLKNENSRLRKGSLEYLFYCIIDNIIDNYFVILDIFDDKIGELEIQVANKIETDNLQDLQNVRKDLIHFRRTVSPLRDVVSKLLREKTFESENINHFFWDTYNHIIHINETIETFRDISSSLMELNMSIISNKMNEVMKVLTVISTIFIPLTFITGIYGMNFTNMPELNSPYGYRIIVIVMIAIVIAMLFYFKRKRWL
ncbi:MAG: magnesium/cobalt transporter CorA [Chitinophagales bacterium]|nr:magnesium/cobalt transporter CorA [Chitinophagales bacterium]